MTHYGIPPCVLGFKCRRGPLWAVALLLRSVLFLSYASVLSSCRKSQLDALQTCHTTTSNSDSLQIKFR